MGKLSGVGSRVSGFELRGLASDVWLQGFGSRAQRFGFRVSGLMISDSGFRVYGLGFRV